MVLIKENVLRKKQHNLGFPTCQLSASKTLLRPTL